MCSWLACFACRRSRLCSHFPWGHKSGMPQARPVAMRTRVIPMPDCPLSCLYTIYRLNIGWFATNTDAATNWWRFLAACKGLRMLAEFCCSCSRMHLFGWNSPLPTISERCLPSKLNSKVVQNWRKRWGPSKSVWWHEIGRSFDIRTCHVRMFLDWTFDVAKA